jgi:hypothetical protein
MFLGRFLFALVVCGDLAILDLIMSEVSSEVVQPGKADSKKTKDLERTIQRMNLTERGDLEKLGYKLDAEGNITDLPEKSVLTKIRKIAFRLTPTKPSDKEGKKYSGTPMTRRQFLRHSVLAAVATVGLPPLDFTPSKVPTLGLEREENPKPETVGRFHPDYPSLTQEEVARTAKQLVHFLNQREDIMQILPEDGKVLVVNAFRRVGLLLQRRDNRLSPKVQFPTGLSVRGNKLTDFAISQVNSTNVFDNDPVYANGLIALTLINGQSNPDEIHGNAIPRLEDKYVQVNNSSLGCVITDLEVINDLTGSTETALHPDDIVIVIPDDITDLETFFSDAAITSAGDYYSVLSCPPPPRAGSYSSEAFQRYLNTGEEIIENMDPVKPDSHLFNKLGYDGVVTVNIRSGEVNFFEKKDESDSFIPNGELKSFGLVGERLPRRRTLKRYFQEYYRDGKYSYDPRGILYRKTPSGVIPRGTLTPPAIFELQRFDQRNGFGDTPQDVSTRHMVLNVLVKSDRGEISVSEEESPYTLHEIPPISDQRSENFANRRRVVQEALENNSPVEDPFWSHGCVNVDQDFYSRLQQRLQGQLDSGKKIAVVFSYPQLNQPQILEAFPSTFSFSFTDPLTGDNLRFLPPGETELYVRGEPGSETFETEESFSYLDLRDLNLEAPLNLKNDLTQEARLFINYCHQLAGIPEKHASNLYTFAKMPQQGTTFNQLQQAIRNVLYWSPITPEQRREGIRKLFERVKHYQQLQSL